jgi:hypothetical protein
VKTEEQRRRHYEMMGRAALLPGMLHLKELIQGPLDDAISEMREALTQYQAEQLAAADGSIVTMMGRRRRGRPTNVEVAAKAKALASIGGGDVPVKKQKQTRANSWPADPFVRAIEMRRRQNVMAVKKREPLPHPDVGVERDTAKFNRAVEAMRKSGLPRRSPSFYKNKPASSDGAKVKAGSPRKKQSSPNHPRHRDHPGHAAWIALTTKNRMAAVAARKAAQ